MTTSQPPLHDTAPRFSSLIQNLSLDTIRSPRHWLRRQRELAQLEPRKRDIEVELARHLKYPVRLVSNRAMRCYDEVYLALHDGCRAGIVRVNSPVKSEPVIPRDTTCLAIPLLRQARLDREWSAYTQLAPLDLAPQPLWRSDDAIACGWINRPRMSDAIIRDRQQFWSIVETVLPAVRQMHEAGVTHLDLNPGNILVDTENRKVAFIDFEFGPNEGVTEAVQRAYDYLRLVAECLRRRRGGPELLKNPDRLIRLLNETVDESSRSATISLSSRSLQRIAGQPELCPGLRGIFRGLTD